MDNEAKHRILFVCHGNICRSPMAEFVMKDLVKKAGLSGTAGQIGERLRLSENKAIQDYSV